jgi:hypothetical protein
MTPATLQCKKRSRDVYVYFDNDIKVRARRCQKGLMTRVQRILK